MNQVSGKMLIEGARRGQRKEDMIWLGKHLTRIGKWNGEDIAIFTLPLIEWQKIGAELNLYEEKGKKNVSV